MLRRATTLLTRPASSLRAARVFSTEVAESPNSAFYDAWKKVAPHIDPPKTPMSFMKPRPAVPSSIPTKLTVNFVLPYASELSSKEFGFGLISTWCNRSFTWWMTVDNVFHMVLVSCFTFMQISTRSSIRIYSYTSVTILADLVVCPHVISISGPNLGRSVGVFIC